MIKILKIKPEENFTNFYININKEYMYDFHIPTDIYLLKKTYKNLFRVRDRLTSLQINNNKVEEETYYILKEFLENGFTQMQEFKNYYINRENPWGNEWLGSPMFKSIKKSIEHTNKLLTKLYDENKDYDGEKFIV